MDEKKLNKKIERADMLKSFDFMEQSVAGQTDKENVHKMREKLNEHLNQFETPEFQDKMRRFAETAKDMAQSHGLDKERVKKMSPEEKQALAREFMERMGMEIPDKLKKKNEKQ